MIDSQLLRMSTEQEQVKNKHKMQVVRGHDIDMRETGKPIILAIWQFCINIIKTRKV